MSKKKKPLSAKGVPINLGDVLVCGKYRFLVTGIVDDRNIEGLLIMGDADNISERGTQLAQYWVHATGNLR